MIFMVLNKLLYEYRVVKSLQITSAPQRATLPEKAPLDFLVRPPSKSYPAEIIRAKKAVQDRQTKVHYNSIIFIYS